jgi:hypothetical protein
MPKTRFLGIKMCGLRKKEYLCTQNPSLGKRWRFLLNIFSFRCGFSTPNSLCSLYFFAFLSLFSPLSSCTLSFLRYALPEFSALTLLFRTKLTHPTALTSLARLTFFLCVLVLLARKKNVICQIKWPKSGSSENRHLARKIQLLDYPLCRLHTHLRQNPSSYTPKA